MKNMGMMKKFFANYIWLGGVIILISALLDVYYPENKNYFLKLIINILETIGVSIFVAAIFTFASSTSEFINRIQTLLEKIILKRDFLANIDPQAKKEALTHLIQPSASEKNKYPNIGDYYGYFINKTLSISKKNVRSNYSINCRAFFCPKINRMAVEGAYAYRLYPSSNGFNDITIGFEDKESFCSSIRISTPNGDIIKEDNLELKEYEEGGDITYRASISLKKFDTTINHLDVELITTEYGTDHWQLLQFKALQPTDGFRFLLHCDGDIVVKQHAIFVVEAKFNLDVTSDNKKMSFTCNQWVNEGSGLCVLISCPQQA